MKNTVRWLLVIVAFWCLGVGGASEVQAATNYVTVTGTGSGADWANATSLTNALVISQSNDVIWLEQGTYTNTATFTIASNNVSLYGGFTNGMATLAERNWTSYPTLLDGKAQNIRVVTVSGANVLLDGLIITNSYGAAAGGITKTTAGALTLANCRVVNHVRTASSTQGVGAYFSNGSVLMTNCVISRNSATDHSVLGLGVYSKGASLLQVVDCVFSNQYGDGSGSRTATGVGLFFDQGQLQVFRSVFLNNAAGANNFYQGWGGGSAVYLGNNATFSAVFSNCVFRGNAGLGGSGQGAGAVAWVQLADNTKTAAFVNCTFAYNTNFNGNGGAFYVSSGTVELRNSLLWSNTVTASGTTGREVYMAGGTLRARYSGITGTTLPHVYVSSGSLTLSPVMTNDPVFASATDLQVKSVAGRWLNGSWVNDTVYSPAIDAGDPADGVGGELSENGARVNLGMYAGTAEASKSPSPEGPKVANRSALTNSYTQMILRGELTNNAAVLATVGICYGTNSIAEETTNGWQYVTQIYPPQQTGTVFSVTTLFLLTNTTYYYRNYATNAYGGSWAPVESFVTDTNYPPLWGVGGGTDVIHVRSVATGEGDGRDWYNAYTTIGAGIAAISGTRTNIWITGATYAEGIQRTLSSSAVLVGGFVGGETAVSQRPTNSLGVVTNYTVMNGAASHVCLSITAASAGLDAMIFSNSVARSLTKSGTGTLTLNNCQTRKNSGSSSGVGAYLSGGTVKLYGCRITDNSGNGGGNTGGGIHFDGCTALMTNCVVSGNRVGFSSDSHSGAGIGIYGNNACNLEVVDCVFSNNVGHNNNTRHGRGSGLAFDGSGALRVRRTEFVGNIAVGGGEYGGNLGGGGAVYLGNSATMSAVFSNCLFRTNIVQATAGAGGAVQVKQNSAVTSHFVNCSFAFNTVDGSDGRGGAIQARSGTVNLKNCILWTNAAADGSEINAELGAKANASYSLLTGVTSPRVGGSGTITPANYLTGDPLFASATDLHLQSPTGRWDSASGTFVTTDTQYSQCIDAGHPDDPVGDEQTPNGNRINMGVYGGTAQASKSPPPAPPYLRDLGASVLYHRARVSCDLTNSTFVSASLYLCYGTTPVAGNTTNGWQGVISGGEGANASVWTPALSPTTLHYYRWYAVNNDGSDWTATNTFTTGTLPPSGGADVIHVDKNAVGVGDGIDWANACTKIQDGFALIGGTRTNVWITGATYSELVQLSLVTNAMVIGGFAGGETAVAQRATNAAGVATNYTVVNGANANRCLSITAGNVWLDTLVFSNSPYARGLSKTGSGNLVMNNCKVMGNRGDTTSGGGAYLSGGAISLYGCQIASNQCDGSGAGVHFASATVFMTNCVVAGNRYGFNSPDGAHSQVGNGVYASGCSMDIVDCVFRDQVGDLYGARVGRGGGLAFDGGTLRVSRCEFTGNRNVGSAYSGNVGGGAGVFLGSTAGQSAVFSNCVFRANEVMRTSAGDGVNPGAVAWGAAVQARLHSASTAAFVNCTFAYNTNDCGYGGAVMTDSGRVVLKNCVLWTNQSIDAYYTNPGYEIYATNAAAVVTATYSDFTGTNAPQVVAVGGASVALGAGILAADPLFASATDLHLKSKGGRWDPAGGTWVRDTVVSPCIDTGDPSDPVGAETQPNGGKINMGAYGGTAQASRSLDPGSIFRFR